MPGMAVPYEGVAGVSPNITATPNIKVDTPLAAFGGNIANAVSHLGDVTTKAADELYGRAIAIETLNQQAEAARAETDYVIKAGEELVKYGELQGKNAVDGYKPYIENLKKMREQGREGLNSPYAQRAYDTASRFQFARGVFSGARHAKEQNRSFIVNAEKARITANNVNAITDPYDEEGYRAGIADNVKRFTKLGQINGEDPDVTKLNIQQANAKLAKDRIDAAAERDPEYAEQLRKQAIKDGILVGPAAYQTQEKIIRKQNTVTARRIGNDTATGRNLALGDTDQVSPTMAREAIKSLSGPAPAYYVADTNENGEEVLGPYRIPASKLGEWLQEAGMPSMTQEQFLKSPQAQDKLFDYKFGQLMKEKKSFNEAVGAWYGDKAGPANVVEANKYLAAHSTRSEKDAAARRLAEKIAPNNPELPDLASRETETMHGRQAQIARDANLRNKISLNKAISDFTQSNDGKLPTSSTEITTTPETKAAWDALDEPTKVAYMNLFLKNSQGGYTRTPENQQMFTTLVGQLTNPQLSAEDREGALKVDANLLPLPADQRKRIADLQIRLSKSLEVAPDVNRAMRVLEPTLRALKNFDFKKDGDDLKTFRGSLSEIIKDRMQDLKRPLNDEEIKRVGTDLLRDMATKKLWVFPSTDKAFRIPVPSNIRERIIKDYRMQNNGNEPSDTDVQIMWNRIQARSFDQAFKKNAPKPKISDRVQ